MAPRLVASSLNELHRLAVIDLPTRGLAEFAKRAAAEDSDLHPSVAPPPPLVDPQALAENLHAPALHFLIAEQSK